MAQVLKGDVLVKDATDRRRNVKERTVRHRLDALKNKEVKGKPGPKSTLTPEVEKELVAYIEDHVAKKMCRYQHEVWTSAEELALDAQVRAKGSSAIEPGSRWRATKGWWYGFKRRHPKVVMRIKEALATERADAENAEANEAWHTKYAQYIQENNLDANHVWIVDEAGAFFGYGKKEKVCAMSGTKTTARVEREEREWFSVMGGGNAAGLRLPPCYFFKRPIPAGFLERDDCYALKVPKGFNTGQAWRRYIEMVLIPPPPPPCLIQHYTCPSPWVPCGSWTSWSYRIPLRLHLSQLCFVPCLLCPLPRFQTQRTRLSWLFGENRGSFLDSGPSK